MTESERIAIRIRDLTRWFLIKGRPIHALAGIDLDVRAGEFLCIVGPSGCGKTTILRILAGLDRQTTGSIEVVAPRGSAGSDGQPLSSVVFQEQSIFPWMRVRDNVAFGLRARGISRAVRTRIAAEHIRQVGLSEFADAWPHQLSGGMKQRVAIARALANDPHILLMDEPFAALDEQTKLVLQDELLRIWERSRKTVLYVTHSLDEAILLADRVLVMSQRPGRILRILDMPFDRPRTIRRVRSDARYGPLFNEIWELLRHNVARQPLAAEVPA
ncbi:MAG: ABC transporter ATP-binding protein [Planctomycetes bacterium]|nr:ABC transporter ATP-binding protein [Planctomycetota bacterium]